MEHSQLIEVLRKYGDITDMEESNVKKRFHIINVKKNEKLIEATKNCDKLYFINKGLLRVYCIDCDGNEFTRRIAWEGDFLTNMDSFIKGGLSNNETIECIESGSVLQISKTDLDFLLSSSTTLLKIYQTILEKLVAINIRRHHHLSEASPMERLMYFNKNYPSLKNRINDRVLASFLSVSRSTLMRAKRDLLKKSVK